MSDGRIQPGDDVVEVDGMKLIGLPYRKSVGIIKATSDKATFRVRRLRRKDDTTQPNTPAEGMEVMVTMDTPLGNKRDEAQSSKPLEQEALEGGSTTEKPLEQEALEGGSTTESVESPKEALVTDWNVAIPTQALTTPTQPMPDEATGLHSRSPPPDHLNESIGMRVHVCV